MSHLFGTHDFAAMAALCSVVLQALFGSANLPMEVELQV